MANNATQSSSGASRVIAKVKNRLNRRIRMLFNIEVEQQLSGFSIDLPADHLLPLYQKEHKLYDRFLPHLSKYIGAGSTVVDVGANCGDTLGAMYAVNGKLRYVCIEPDDTFFRFLEKNIQRIREFDESASIIAIQSLVGKAITDVSLQGSGGTKKAIAMVSGKSIKSRTLDSVLSAAGVRNVRLLKSDVDGFDYDVINSAEVVIRSDSPILYFECQFDHQLQKEEYLETVTDLHLSGYTNWVVFDNFGEVVLRTTEVQQINQLFEYVWRQNIGRATRTLHYYDLLGATERDSGFLGRVVDDYIAMS